MLQPPQHLRPFATTRTRNKFVLDAVNVLGVELTSAGAAVGDANPASHVQLTCVTLWVNSPLCEL